MRRFALFLIVLVTACGDDGGVGVDSGVLADGDLGLTDARRGEADGGRGFVDAGTVAVDAAPMDAAPMDATPMDAAPVDAAPVDATAIDAAAFDAGLTPDATVNAVMTFFVTSTGSGSSGGNLGGLTGADAKCQALGSAGGAGGRTWRAYLSTGATGPGPIVDAGDRIGAGPWVNQQGVSVAADLSSLHTSGILGSVVLDEFGAPVPSNEHDVLTGTATDGTLHDDSTTCDNWTDGSLNTQGQVGHCDTETGDGESWNSQHSGSCDAASLAGNAGSGRLYCFAID